MPELGERMVGQACMRHHGEPQVLVTLAGLALSALASPPSSVSTKKEQGEFPSSL